VKTKGEVALARGLHACVRQRRDVVRCGEIREKEAASIAVQASLTGGLVLSSLHKKTAIVAIMRLKDIGVELLLLASSLEMVMAQRLVRVLCQQCRVEHVPTAAECERLSLPADAVIYQAQGCSECKNTGYRGRTAIYELISIDRQLRQLIHEGAGEQAMLAHARQTSPSLTDDGRRRILAGETSLEEVLRVTAVS